MPKYQTRLALLLLCAVYCSSSPAAAQQTALKEGRASVSGVVTVDGKPASDIVLTLSLADDPSQNKSVARAKTDGAGRYLMSGIPPGQYQLFTVAPAYVGQDTRAWMRGQPLTLSPGDEVEDVNFDLKRGGVITGRIMDSEGRPVMEEMVNVHPEDKELARNIQPMIFSRSRTDDRGEYRIYGLPAGRYRISVGQDKNSGMVRVGGPNRFVERTFYPGTPDESQARVIEVTHGGEATGMDITLPKISRAYSATGRVVDAETGQPVPEVAFGYGSLRPDGKSIGAFGMTGARTNARGEFRIEGLAPGRYGVFATSPDREAEWHSSVAVFEVDDADVGGLEVKIHKGASISGTVVMEGADPATRARLLSQLALHAFVQQRSEITPPIFGSTKPTPDGSFRLKALRPGKTRIVLGWPQVKGVTLLRVEHGGSPQPEGIDVAPGAQITGVRVVLAYGTAVVKGTASVGGGTLPEGSRLFVGIRRAGERTAVFKESVVDARGRFQMEGLAAGEYELILRASAPVGSPPVRMPNVRQAVSVAEGGETTVALVLDLSKGEPQ